MLKKHRKTCGPRVKTVFPANTEVRPKQLIWDRLRSAGVKNLPSMEEFLYATYDFESLLKALERHTQSTSYYQRHVALSVAVYANFHHPDEPPPVDGYKPHYIVNGKSVRELVEAFIDKLHQLSDAAYAIKKRKYADIIADLDRQVDWAIRMLGLKQDANDENGTKLFKNVLRKKLALYNDFDAHLRQLLVCGYNRYTFS